MVLYLCDNEAVKLSLFGERLVRGFHTSLYKANVPYITDLSHVKMQINHWRTASRLMFTDMHDESGEFARNAHLIMLEMVESKVGQWILHFNEFFEKKYM